MSVFLQPIYTQTVGSGGATSITFNNIPQGFTDLKIIVSARFTSTGTNPYFGFLIVNPNGSTTGFSETFLSGNGSSTLSGRFTGNGAWLTPYRSIPNASTTSNTFSNTEIYLPNYNGSNFKQAIVDGVGEFNSATGATSLQASLWSNSSAITSISITGYIDNASWGSFAQHSTITLYGITRG
jgi:hypothetical protein